MSFKSVKVVWKDAYSEEAVTCLEEVKEAEPYVLREQYGALIKHDGGSITVASGFIKLPIGVQVEHYIVIPNEFIISVQELS